VIDYKNQLKEKTMSLWKDFQLILFAILGIALLSIPCIAENSAPINQGDLPVICYDCPGVTIDYGDLIVWPGDSILVPVKISNTTALSLIQITGESSNPNLVIWNAHINFTDTKWNNSWYQFISITDGGTKFELNVGGTLPVSATSRRTFDLIMKLNCDTPFGTTYYLNFGSLHEARFGSNDPNCNIATTSSGIYTIKPDTAKVIVVGVNASSNQASDANDACKDDFPVKARVRLYSNFPTGHYGIWLHIPDDLTYVGFDPAGNNAEASLDGNDCFITGTPATRSANSATFDIGDIKLKVADFSGNYSNHDYTTSLALSLLQGPENDPTHIYTWPDTNICAVLESNPASSIPYGHIYSNMGSITLPRYNVSFDVKDAMTDWDNHVTVPVVIHPNFWTQAFLLYMDIDPDYLAYDSVHTVGDAPPVVVPGSGYWGSDDTDPNRDVYQFHSDDHPNCKYAMAGCDDTLFTLHFTTQAGFGYGQSTEIRFNDYSTSHVHDYFSTNENKISREYSDGSTYWQVSPGTVTRPGKYTLDATAHSTGKNGTTFDISIYITEIHIAGSEADVQIQNSAGMDSITAGDFPLESINCMSSGYPPTTFKAIIVPTNAITTTGKLCQVWFHNNNAGTFYISPNTSTNCGMYYDAGQYFAPVSKGDTAQYYPKMGKQDSDVPLPYTTALFQNYPNPFNPVTTIEYSLAREGYAKLEVFDLLGRKVVTLVDEKQLPGIHKAAWDAASFPSGTYLYRLRTNDFEETKKLLLLK
jgi:hypothetical protein